MNSYPTNENNGKSQSLSILEATIKKEDGDEVFTFKHQIVAKPRLEKEGKHGTVVKEIH